VLTWGPKPTFLRQFFTFVQQCKKMDCKNKSGEARGEIYKPFLYGVYLE
jgi:hypothetical protein